MPPIPRGSGPEETATPDEQQARAGSEAPTTEALPVKYDAPTEMNEADPPSWSRCQPKGPSVSSTATEPTTSASASDGEAPTWATSPLI